MSRSDWCLNLFPPWIEALQIRQGNSAYRESKYWMCFVPRYPNVQKCKHVQDAGSLTPFMIDSGIDWFGMLSRSALLNMSNYSPILASSGNINVSCHSKYTSQWIEEYGYQNLSLCDPPNEKYLQFATGSLVLPPSILLGLYDHELLWKCFISWLQSWPRSGLPKTLFEKEIIEKGLQIKFTITNWHLTMVMV